MPGTKEGAAKTRAKNLERDPLYYQHLGAMGGVKKVPKGFARMPLEKRMAAGSTGGSRSKRGPARKVES